MVQNPDGPPLDELPDLLQKRNYGRAAIVGRPNRVRGCLHCCTRKQPGLQRGGHDLAGCRAHGPSDLPGICTTWVKIEAALFASVGFTNPGTQSQTPSAGSAMKGAAKPMRCEFSIVSDAIKYMIINVIDSNWQIAGDYLPLKKEPTKGPSA